MKENKKKKKMTKRKRQKLKIFGLILLILVLLILLVVSYGLSKWSKLDRINFGKDDIETNDLSEETKKNMKGYTTLAMFGVDNRSNGNFESGNSDTIIIVSINNKSGEIRMASVYRDTYVNIEEDTYNKVNSAYNRGGPKQAINMLNRNFDLNITDYVSVDFNALVDAVDAIGGIELEITGEEASYMNSYIEELIRVTGKSSNYVSAGTQVVDGIQATAYARVRYTTGWDYKRTERQRTVIMKIFEKAKKADFGTLNSILDTMLPEVSTSLSLTEMLGMAKNAAKYNMGENAGFPYEPVSVDIGSVKFAVVGSAGFEANVTELHKFLYGSENYTASATVKEISEVIRNKSGY